MWPKIDTRFGDSVLFYACIFIIRVHWITPLLIIPLGVGCVCGLEIMEIRQP